MKEIPREIWGSLQDHHAVCEIRGGGKESALPLLARTSVYRVFYSRLSKPIPRKGKIQYFLNGSGDVASTLICGHDYSGNIIAPKGGHKQMGVLEEYEDTETKVSY